jgi:emfourin
MASESSSEHVRVHFRRSGGLFAGNRLEVDVGREDLDPAAADALDRVLDGPRPEAPPPPAGAADDYQYDLTVRRGEQVVSLRLAGSGLPPELVPLVDALEQRALDRRG